MTIEIGSLGPFSTAEPSSLTFEGAASRRRRRRRLAKGGGKGGGGKGGEGGKGDKSKSGGSTLASWDTKQYVTIVSTAASSKRPVCPLGHRTCAELRDRFETVDHSVSSADPLWDGIGGVSLNLSVSVVYDTMDPPAVVSSRFVDALNAIEIAFTGTTDRGKQKKKFDCSKLINMTALPPGALGKKGACSWESANVLLVTLGSGAKIVPGDTIALLPSSIKASAAGSSLGLTNATVPVDTPLSPTHVDVVLSGAATVGVCDDIKLDGSMTTGSGGRPLQYSFSSDTELLANCSSDFKESNEASGGTGSHSIMLPSEKLPVASYEVTLTASNFLGETGSKTLVVKKLGVPAPVVSFQGTSPKYVKRSDELVLRLQASLPEIGCAITSTGSMGKHMVYTFSELTGAFSGRFIGVNPRVLRVPEDSLVPGITYRFLGTVAMAANPGINGSAVIEVVVVAQDLVARIEGGDERVVGVDSAFDLDASASYDPDDEAADHLKFSWSCSNATSGSAVDLDLEASAVLTVPALALIPGSFVFRVVVHDNRSPARNTSTAVTIHITAGNPPLVSVASLEDTKFNANDNFVRLAGSVTTSGASPVRDISWSIEDGDVDAATAMLPSATGSHHALTVVDLSALTAGSTYVFRLTATNAWGTSSFAQVELTMNRPPSSGSLEVSPSAGYTFDTDFEFVGLGWVDEDLPLQYKFGFDADGSGGSITPLGDFQSSATYTKVLLPQGRQSANYTIVGMVSVMDTYGAVGSTQENLRVTPVQLSSAALANRSRTLAQSFIDEGDPDGCMQVISATLRSLQGDVTESAQRRRQILSFATGDALDTSLYYIEEAYSMSDLSDSSVETLLSNIADVASLVTGDSFTIEVAWETLRILRIPLHDLRSDGSALTATAVASVVSAISDLLLSPLFNGTASSTASTGSFSAKRGGRTALRNVSLALAEVASGQLREAYDGVGYASSAALLSTYFYRSEAQYLAGASVMLSSSAVGITFPSNFSEHPSLADDIDSTDLVDVRVTEFDVNVHGFYNRFAASPYVSVVTPLLQTELLLASTERQVAVEGIDVTTQPLLLTLNTTEPLDIDFDAWMRSGMCPPSSASSPEYLDFSCPFGNVTHQCEEGNGHAVDLKCPGIVPECLYWEDSGVGEILDGRWVQDAGICTVHNYSANAVTCACGRLGDIIVATNLSASVVTRTYTPVPSSAPTDVPVPMPSARPNPSPSNEPVFAPSKVPFPSPTSPPSQKPVPAPSAGPIAVPTSPPSLVPSVSGAVVLSTSMTMTADSAPTAGQKNTLKATIASSMGISEATFTSFTVNVSTTTTRHRHLLSSSYSWLVSMEISSTLTEMGYSDAETMTTGVSSVLSTSSFEEAVESDLGVTVTVDTSSIATTLLSIHTSSPVRAPTLKPSAGSSPTTPSSGGSSGDSSGSSSGGSSEASGDDAESSDPTPTAEPTAEAEGANSASAMLMTGALVGAGALLMAASGLVVRVVRRRTAKRSKVVVLGEAEAEGDAMGIKDADATWQFSGAFDTARTPREAFDEPQGRTPQEAFKGPEGKGLKLAQLGPTKSRKSPRKRDASPRIASEVSNNSPRGSVMRGIVAAIGYQEERQVTPRKKKKDVEEGLSPVPPKKTTPKTGTKTVVPEETRSRSSSRSKKRSDGEERRSKGERERRSEGSTTTKINVRPRVLEPVATPSTSEDAKQRLKSTPYGTDPRKSTHKDKEKRKKKRTSPSSSASSHPSSL